MARRARQRQRVGRQVPSRANPPPQNTENGRVIAVTVTSGEISSSKNLVIGSSDLPLTGQLQGASQWRIGSFVATWTGLTTASSAASTVLIQAYSQVDPGEAIAALLKANPSGLKGSHITRSSSAGGNRDWVSHNRTQGGVRVYNSGSDKGMIVVRASLWIRGTA
jgi:hypothetical protein